MLSKTPFFLLCILLLTVIPSRAQDIELLKSRTLTALRRADIASPGIEPYRIQANLTMYDGAGKNPVTGTATFWRDKNHGRVTVTFPGGTSTLLTTPEGQYTGETGTLPPFAFQLARSFRLPLSFEGFLPTTTVAGHRKVLGVDTLCLPYIIQGESFRGPGGPDNNICLAEPNDELRAITYGSMVFVREGHTPFADHDIARSLRLMLSGITVGQLQVETIEHLPEDDVAWTTPTPDLHLIATGAARIAGNVIAGLRIGGQQPKYPGIARAAHMQGTVVLRAVIDKTGHIRDLSPISSPDKVLSEAATKAVATWTYQPYLLDGNPVEVDTTIMVTFSLGDKKK